MGNVIKKLTGKKKPIVKDPEPKPIEIIPEKATDFSLDGLEICGRVTEVISGDSLSIIFKFRESYNTWSCRIYGIDAPGPRDGPELKEKYLESKKFLEKLLLGKCVNVFCKETDAFGRILVILDYGGLDVAETMVSKELAKKI
jgi:endonuclease YncB( thermonuclease family)